MEKLNLMFVTYFSLISEVIPDSDESDDAKVTKTTTTTTTATTITTKLQRTDQTNKAPLGRSTTASMPTIDGSNSSLTVAIILPLICALIVAALVAVYFWRRKRSTLAIINTATVKEPSAPEEIQSNMEAYDQESCYAVIPTEKEQEDVTSDGYSAVDETATEDKAHIVQEYDHVLQNDIQFVNQGYSHITDPIKDDRVIDNEYAQVNKVFKFKEDSLKASYNKLNMQQTSSRKEHINVMENKDMVSEDTGYNHCIAGKDSQTYEGDGYSHLISS